MRQDARLIYNANTPEEQAYPFVDQIVIGRKRSKRAGPVRVAIKDPAISGRHCVIRQGDNGRFFVRDESRNGTRVESRRLVPNVEVEVFPGNRIQVARNHVLTLKVDAPQYVEDDEEEDEYEEATRALTALETEVTIVVGDIKGYTTLNHKFKASDVLPSVQRAFAQLEGTVDEFGGTIKEYQGDAIFAFWEYDPASPDWHTIEACRCTMALNKKVKELAADPEVWTIEGHPLDMDWAITTGNVVITAIGGDRVTGLAMVGDAVNYAFRLEKLANEERGKILGCHHTEARARNAIKFASVGSHQVAGRAAAEPVFAIQGVKEDFDAGELKTMTLDLSKVKDELDL